MNRRSFLRGLGLFTILAPATTYERIWKVRRELSFEDLDAISIQMHKFETGCFYFIPSIYDFIPSIYDFIAITKPEVFPANMGETIRGVK